MTMGLINGMDDVIAYIQKVEKENKELKEKQEKFRVRHCERMEELVKALSPWKKNHEDHKRILEAIGELKQENKELKEENKRLTEALAVSEKPSLKQCLSEAMKENGSWMTDMKKDYEVQLRTQKDMVSMYSKKYRELKEENEKLKEEYELGGKELKEQLNEESQQRLTNKECWMKVQKQYHELKEKYETLEYQYDMEKQCHLEDIDDKQAEIDDVENPIEGERLTHRQVVQDKEAEIEKLQKYAEIMGEIDGDDLSNLLSDYGWEYNDGGELEKKQ